MCLPRTQALPTEKLQHDTPVFSTAYIVEVEQGWRPEHLIKSCMASGNLLSFYDFQIPHQILRVKLKDESKD